MGRALRRAGARGGGEIVAAALVQQLPVTVINSSPFTGAQLFKWQPPGRPVLARQAQASRRPGAGTVGSELVISVAAP